jgi:hypothetical protein
MRTAIQGKFYAGRIFPFPNWATMYSHYALEQNALMVMLHCNQMSSHRCMRNIIRITVRLHYRHATSNSREVLCWTNISIFELSLCFRAEYIDGHTALQSNEYCSMHEKCNTDNSQIALLACEQQFKGSSMLDEYFYFRTGLLCTVNKLHSRMQWWIHCIAIKWIVISACEI